VRSQTGAERILLRFRRARRSRSARSGRRRCGAHGLAARRRAFLLKALAEALVTWRAGGTLVATRTRVFATGAILATRTLVAVGGTLVTARFITARFITARVFTARFITAERTILAARLIPA
jgi:hypothetical protein